MIEPSPHPATIGPFVVLRKLGAGAMGVVYAGYDVALDRKVALKLVRPSLLNNEAVRERMVREAQAMARLSSPHVVQVYQVGAHERSLYVAMEHIDGETLADWLRARPRTWPVVLRTVCDAGRGLAAAHAAGLVHRDFKPDNVLVDADGRARVADFGLVQADSGAEDREQDNDPLRDSQTTVPGAPRSGAQWSTRLTQRGNAPGTPLYMSPEQHFGQPVGPYSDQYSFAITLYQALYAELPFCGDSWDAIRQQIRAGIVPSPSPGSPIPRRLLKIIARALLVNPEARWPSLDAMIAALEHDPWRRPLGGAAVLGLLGFVSAASYTVASSQAHEPPSCQAAALELVDTWDPSRAAALSRAFTATGAQFAGDAFQRVKTRLDDYAHSWADESRAVCEAHATGAQPGRLIDLRIACLGRRKAHLAALVEVLAAADGEVIEHAVEAVAALPSIGACSDADDLVGAAPPPDDPQAAIHVEQLRARLARAAVLEATGKFEPGLALVRATRAEVEALEYAPLAAEAALVEASLKIAAASFAEADVALIRAVRLGIAHDMHAVAAEAAARRIFVLGEGLGRRAEALTAGVFAEALVERARDDGRLAALLSNNLGAVHDLQGDPDTARTYYESTIAGLERRPGPPDPLIAITHHNLGNMYADQREFERARHHFVLAIRLFTQILGDGHPFVAHALAGLGDADASTGAHASALAHYGRALARMETTYGVRHLYLLQPLIGLGRVHAHLGHLPQADSSFKRAIAVADELELVHPMLGHALEGLAALPITSDAPALYQRAAEVYAALGDFEAREQASLRAHEAAALTEAATPE